MTRISTFVLGLAHFGLVSAAITADASIFESTNDNELNMGGYILAVVAILVGGLMVAFGCRFMYETTFATGFALGAISISIITERMLVDESFWSLGSWIAFILGGALCGWLALWVHPKSNFLISVSGGLILATIVTNCTAFYIFPGRTQEVFTLLCVVFVVVFTAFDLKHGKSVEVVGVNISGAAILVWGIGFFIGDFPFPNNLEKYATEDIPGQLVYNVPTAWWGYLGGILVISALGMLMQFRTIRSSAAKDAFEGLEAHGYPSDAMSYVESKMQCPSIEMDQSGNTVQYSTTPSSYPSGAHQSFCRLYSRNTEAESIRKMRLKL